MMKKFTHEVVNLRISLHILSKKVIKVYTEQTCVNLCKLRPRFTHVCPPMVIKMVSTRRINNN